MKQEIYRPFISNIELPKEVDDYQIIFEEEETKILVIAYDYESNNLGGIYQISFSLFPLSFRMIDEGDYLALEEPIPHWFCTVENSKYLEWFHTESLGIRKSQNLVHYGIYTRNMCFDIIDSEIPKITKMKKRRKGS